MCLYPKLINNRKYVSNKKNGGNIPTISDKRTLMVPVKCGKCMECGKAKAREWTIRLSEEIRHDNSGKFVTLTFNDECMIKLEREVNKGRVKLHGYELENAVCKLGMRRFLERWRKTEKKSVKHWFASELGQKKSERVHMHGLLWTEKSGEFISEKWKYGMITIGKRNYDKGKEMNKYELGYVSEKTINYIVKYVSKTDEKHKEYKSIILCSQGIGKKYIDRTDSKRNKYNGKETKEEYTTRNGLKLALPIYYRNKIYNDKERENLWLMKLDKEERWVDGVRVDVSKGEDNYYKILEVAREKSKRLGYSDNAIDWDRKRYENERRNLIKLERVKKFEKIKKERIEPKNEGEIIKRGKIEDAF